MAHWLLKTDPVEYSVADLQREGTTTWTGVRNALAQQYLRAMRAGDDVLLYHTGREKAVVAIGAVAEGPRPDAADAARKAVTVQIAFLAHLPRPVALADIKADPAFATFDLVRMRRLSVMPVPPALWHRLLSRGGGTQRKR